MAARDTEDGAPGRPPNTALALRIRRTESLASLVRKELERMIVSGELKGGDRLNENALAERLGVSRGPIREACRGLEQSGLVEVIVNRGTFVRQIDLRTALGIYDVRAALFGLAGRILATSAAPALLAQLGRLVDAMDRASTDIDAYYPLNVEYHATLVDACDNPHLSATYRNLSKELHLYRRRGLVPRESMQASNREHRAILESIAARDPQRAQALMEAHILAGKARLVRAGDVAGEAVPARAAAGA
jgi:DNA-binding GntR family transcriptional regulator